MGSEHLVEQALQGALRAAQQTSLHLSTPLAAAPATSVLRSQQRRSVASQASTPRRYFTNAQFRGAPNSGSGLLSLGGGSGGGVPASYFQRPSLPANTVIKFVPQQTAWIVERMGRFNRVLEPGLAILIPIIDRIAYVKSLKEAAIEIPSQSAITADNVTLELDGVLYTRVFDPYKAR